MARLTKSRNHWIDGVLGGVAEYFHMNPDLLRIVFLVAVLVLQMHFLITVYIILMILLPGTRRRSNRDGESEDYVQEEEVVLDNGTQTDTGHKEEHLHERKIAIDSGRTMQIFGILLILAGAVYLVQNQFPWIWYRLEHCWFDARHIFEKMQTILLGAALILGGLWLIYKDRKSKRWHQ